MEKTKKCSECLHFKVCIEFQVVDRAMELVKGNNKEKLNEMSQSIANSCQNYLVYDQRSTEKLVIEAKNALRGIEWNIAILENDGKPSKHILLNKSDEWFEKDFLDAMKRSAERLKFIINEPNNS